MDAPEPSAFAQALIDIFRALYIDQIAKLIVEDMKEKGVWFYIGMIAFYRIIMEALVFQRFIKPLFRRKNG